MKLMTVPTKMVSSDAQTDMQHNNSSIKIGAFTNSKSKDSFIPMSSNPTPQVVQPINADIPTNDLIQCESKIQLTSLKDTFRPFP